MVGLGGGMLFLPGFLVLSNHFNHRLALAQGIATSGSCLGEFEGHLSRAGVLTEI